MSNFPEFYEHNRERPTDDQHGSQSIRSCSKKLHLLRCSTQSACLYMFLTEKDCYLTLRRGADGNSTLNFCKNRSKLKWPTRWKGVGLLSGHENLPGFAWTTTARGGRSCSHTSNSVAWLAERVWCTSVLTPKVWRKTYPVCDDPHSARSWVSLLHRNRAVTTVLVCEQKPRYPEWFSRRRKSYTVIVWTHSQFVILLALYLVTSKFIITTLSC